MRNQRPSDYKTTTQAEAIIYHYKQEKNALSQAQKNKIDVTLIIHDFEYASFLSALDQTDGTTDPHYQPCLTRAQLTYRT